MGRCRACNRKLTDFEMTRKEAETGRYIDMCNTCFRASDYDNIPIVERHDLSYEEFDDESDVVDIDLENPNESCT